MAVSAAYHLVLGVTGLFIDRTFPLRAEEARVRSEHIFGIFETNGWHSLAAVLIASVSLYFVLAPRYDREAALWVGLSQLGVVAAFGLWDPETFLFASNGADQWVHATTASGGIAAALVTRRHATEPAGPVVRPV